MGPRVGDCEVLDRCRTGTDLSGLESLRGRSNCRQRIGWRIESRLGRLDRLVEIRLHRHGLGPGLVWRAVVVLPKHGQVPVAALGRIGVGDAAAGPDRHAAGADRLTVTRALVGLVFTDPAGLRIDDPVRVGVRLVELVGVDLQAGDRRSDPGHDVDRALTPGQLFPGAPGSRAERNRQAGQPPWVRPRVDRLRVVVGNLDQVLLPVHREPGRIDRASIGHPHRRRRVVDEGHQRWHPGVDPQKSPDLLPGLVEDMFALGVGTGVGAHVGADCPDRPVDVGDEGSFGVVRAREDRPAGEGVFGPRTGVGDGRDLFAVEDVEPGSPAGLDPQLVVEPAVTRMELVGIGRDGRVFGVVAVGRRRPVEREEVVVVGPVAATGQVQDRAVGHIVFSRRRIERALGKEQVDK